MSAITTRLRENIARVQDAIAEAASRAGRAPDEVDLVAVSKTCSACVVAEAAALGLRRFGENRVQEAADKIPQVAQLAGIPLEWHLIGNLQRNKVRTALPLFALVESVDSLMLAEAIDQRAETPVAVLLEVYLGDDAGRPGFRPADLREQISALARLSRLKIRGLMTVAPIGLDPAATQAIFARVRELRDELAADQKGLALTELSMGMSEDYPLAIAQGATIVRVGRAIFGARPSL
jgi:pyridoxal phosphate enzyme (YggS family)